MDTPETLVTELRNRVKKNYTKLKTWADKNRLTAFRIYDKDLPNFPFTIDKYGKYFVVNQYLKYLDEDFKTELVIKVICDFFEVSEEQVFVKERRRIKDRTDQYVRVAASEKREVVEENGLRFMVNLSDYTDTGLFLDHRLSRAWVREKSKGKRVLNLFCYTGAVTCNAAAGGAREVCSVDLSNTYLGWAEDNMRLNGFGKEEKLNEFIRMDCELALREMVAAGRKFDLIFLDPPSFSNSKKMDGHFDVQAHHISLLKLCLEVLEKTGILFFSNNFRDFKFDLEALNGLAEVTAYSAKTLPQDFRDKKIHNSWLVRHYVEKLEAPQLGAWD